MLLDALRGTHSLLVLDNLESLLKRERDIVFNFVKRLPSGCKAILTSRVRIGSAAEELILDKLSQDAALATLTKLATGNPALAKTDETERINLYNETGGKPLLTGRWDESFAISREAERRAVAIQNFYNAAAQAHRAGWVSYMRGQAAEVLACANRAQTYIRQANVGPRERGIIIRMRGIGHQLAGNYAEAITAYREAVELWKSLGPDSEEIAIGLIALGDAESRSDDFDAAERDFGEALRISKIVEYAEGVALATANLASVALARNEWHSAETLARAALPLCDEIARKDVIAMNCLTLAQALLQQNKRVEALKHSRRAVEIYTSLKSPELLSARQVVAQCEAS